jgi:heme exporter protein D
MSEFLAMGGYAKYVWSAYGISLVVLTLTVILTLRSFKATRSRVLKRQQSQKELQS